MLRNAPQSIGGSDCLTPRRFIGLNAADQKEFIVNRHSRNREIIKQYQHVNAAIEVIPTYHFKRHWVTSFTSEYKSTVRPLSLQQRHVLDVLTDRVCANNLVRVTHKEIAAELEITPNAVSKAISVLCQRGVICKHHNYVHEIAPSILWFGKRENYFKAPSNPSPRTHDFVEVYECGKNVTTLHFPIVHTYEQYQRRYGRLQSKTGGKIDK